MVQSIINTVFHQALYKYFTPKGKRANKPCEGSLPNEKMKKRRCVMSPIESLASITFTSTYKFVKNLNIKAWKIQHLGFLTYQKLILV